MGDAPAKVLEIIGGILAAAMIMLFAFSRINQAKDTAGKADEIVNSMTNALENDKYTQYDGATVKGNEVLSFIQTSKSDVICVVVKNGTDTTEYIRKLSDLSQAAAGKIADAKNKALVTTKYIDPSVNYDGRVLYLNDDPTQTIIGVEFTRQ